VRSPSAGGAGCVPTDAVPGRLVVRLAPRPEEPLDLFLMRLGGSNGTGGPRRLLAQVGLAGTARSVRSDLAPLAVALGAADGDVSLLERLGRWRDPISGRTRLCGRAISATALGRPLGRICPGCLRSGTAFRWQFDSKAVLACERHGCWLRDGCAGCGRRLDWNREHVDRCPCGLSLDAPTPAAPPGAIALAGKVSEIDRGGGFPLSLSEALELVWFAAVRNGEGLGRGAAVDRPTVSRTWRFLEPVVDLLDDWPDKFSAWIVSSRRGELRSSSLYDQIPILMNLKETFGNRVPAITEAAALAARDATHLIPVRSHSSYHRSGGPNLDAASAAALLGIAPPSVACRIERGELAGRLVMVGGRRAVSVQRSDLAGMIRRKSDTPEAIGSFLGLSEAQAVALRRSLGRMRGAPPADREAMRSLVRELDGLASPDPAPADVMPLAAVTAMRGPGLPGAVSLVLSGSLGLWRLGGAADPPFRRLGVSRAELLRAAGGGLSVREIAALLKVPTRLVPKLLEAGCIATTGASRRRCVDVEAVRRCSEHFATGAQLAASVGTNARTLLARLATAGLEPLVPSDPANGISSVWDRARVEDIMRGDAARTGWDNCPEGDDRPD